MRTGTSAATSSRRARPASSSQVITGKTALRCVQNAQISLTDVRVPAENRLADCHTFRDVEKVLLASRFCVAWEALGAADRRLRDRAGLRQAAPPVRHAARRLPARAGPSWRGCWPTSPTCISMLLAAQPAHGRGQDDDATHGRAGQDALHPSARGPSSPTPATCSAATASCSTTTSPGTSATSRRSTPTRAPTRAGADRRPRHHRTERLRPRG